MKNPELADKILQNLIVTMKWQTASEIGEILNQDYIEVERTLMDMRTDRVDWIAVNSNDPNHYYYLAYDRQRVEINIFLKSGGYQKTMQEMNAAIQAENEFKDLQTQNLKATTAQAKQAIKDSKFAKKMAWFSLGISILALIISLLKG